MRKLPAREDPMTLRTLPAAAQNAALRAAAQNAALRVAACAALLTALSVVCVADGPATCPAIDQPAAAQNAAPSAGVRAAIDPATGAVRPPTAAERAAAEARRRAEHAEARRKVEVVVHPNGMRTAKLGDAFLFDVVVERRPDGTLGTRCVPRSHPAANLPTETK
jgi:hypothetical protein